MQIYYNKLSRVNKCTYVWVFVAVECSAKIKDYSFQQNILKIDYVDGCLVSAMAMALRMM